MNCPRCSVALQPSSIHEASIVFDAHSCPDCKGYWLSSSQLAQAQGEVKQEFVEFRRIPTADEQMVVLDCPTCADSVQMEKVVNERDKKVVMDVCPGCKNIWLDGGELDAIRKDSLLSLLIDCYRWKDKN